MFSYSYNRVTSYFVLVALASFLTPAAAFADDAAVGKEIFSTTCIACHGANGKGAIPGVADFTKADGPLAKSDETLFVSIRDGLVTPGKPLSMPPKGGNPTLSDEDIQAVLAYVRKTFGP